MKKTIIGIVVAVLIIVAVVMGIIFLKKDNIEYVEFENVYAGFKAKAGLPKDANLVFTMGDEKHRGEFLNEEEEYKIRLLFPSDNKSLYDNNKKIAEKRDGYEEFETKNAKGYAYNSTSFTRTYRLILGENKKGAYCVAQVEIARTKNFSEGIDSIMEFKEIHALLNSVQLVETYEVVEEEKVQQEQTEENKTEE